MDKILKKLETLFEKNNEWHNDNVTTPGDENPYPDKIQETFIKYYTKNYKAEVSYVTKEDGKVCFSCDEDTIWNATNNAFFDCFDVDACFDEIEYWIKDLYERYLYEENRILLKNIEVNTVSIK